MPARRVPTQVKKAQGTYNVTDDKNKDFVLLDGIVMATPVPPSDFKTPMIAEWEIVWKHLISHEYGKAADVKLVEMYIRCLYRWELSIKTDDANAAAKWHSQCLKCPEALGLNPAAMAKVAILQKKSTPAQSKIEQLKKGAK